MQLIRNNKLIANKDSLFKSEILAKIEGKKTKYVSKFGKSILYGT